MRVIPGMTVIVPCDAAETYKDVQAAYKLDGPVYLRLARPVTPVFTEKNKFEIGKANVLCEGGDIVVFACGIMVHTALECAKLLKKEGINASVVNVHTVKPIDRECVLRMALKCKKVVTVEEHSVIGGLGDTVADVLMGNGNFKFRKIGIQARFGQSGKPDELMTEYGLDLKSIYSCLLYMCGK
jgi:transketolase